MLTNMSPRTGSSTKEYSGSRRLRNRVLFVAIVLGSCLLGLYANTNSPQAVADIERREEPQLDARGGSTSSRQCPSIAPPAARPPAPVNLWAPLSTSEINGVHEFVRSSRQGFNITAVSPSPSDNSIFVIESLHPPKAEALHYLANPKKNRPPARNARVVVHFGAQQPQTIKEYIVGPLPVSRRTTLTERTGVYHREDIPYNARGISYNQEISGVISTLMPPLREAMEALLGGFAVGGFDDTLGPEISAPWGTDGSFRRAWLYWKRSMPGSFVNALPFLTYVDFSGTDTSQWKILKIVYDGQIFASTEDFLAAFHSGSLTPVPAQPNPLNETHIWTTRNRPNPDFQLDLDDRAGPRSVSFDGLRFRVDKKLNFVSWMGWGFYLGFDRDMGMSLWDIRFRGERIIYELAPHEAIAQYAGANPFYQSTAWLDRYFGMGSSVRPLMPLYDCPAEAVYLSANIYTHSDGGSNQVVDRAICVFEQDTTRPVTRHIGWYPGESGAVKGYTLVVRSVASVGNYDYMWDYTFHLDGTIEARVSASGYIQGAWSTPAETPFGGKVWHTAVGALHDHVINYKVDLDVVGTANSLLRTTLSQEEMTADWFDEDWGQTVIQQKVTREYIDNEDDARVVYPPNYQGGYAIVNKDEKNKWGTVRGYSILPGNNFVHATVAGSPRLRDNANWARYNLAVSRQKDNEQSSSTMWNQHLPHNPMINFHNFFNGESLDQEDLVAWVNVGTHHLPQAEDAPMTRMTAATTSFIISPLSYFDSDVSMDTKNAVFLNLPAGPDQPWTHDDYGVDQAKFCIPHRPQPFDYFDPQSTVIVSP